VRLLGDAFARRVRSLGAAEQRAFLAALWEARGYETADTGEVVTARQGGETVRIGVAGWRPPDVEADVFVGTRDTARVRRHAADRGARFVPPEELRELLLYGIDREVAAELARTHLGRPLSAFAGETAGGFEGRSPLVGVGALALAVVAVVALAGGAIFAVPPEDESTGETAKIPEPETPTPAPAPNETPTQDSEGYPDGLSADGVTDPEMLLETHRGVVDDRPHTVAVEFEKSANSTAPVPTLLGNVTRFERTIQLGAGNRSSFSQTATLESANGTQRVRLIAYRESAAVTARIIQANETGEIQNVTYGRLARPPGPYVGLVTDAERTVVDTLSTNTTDVERYARADRALYRVTATGEPAEFGRETAEYRAVAYLTADGRFVRLTVGYTDPETGERVTLELSVTGVDETEIAFPEWAG